MKQWIAALLLASFGLMAWANAADGAGSAADQQFRAIYESEWSWRQSQFPGLGAEKDSTLRVDRLPSVDAQTLRERLQKWDQVLVQLDAVPQAELSAAERVNFAIYRPQIANLAAEIRLLNQEMPFNSDSSFWSDLGFMTRRPLRTRSDAESYIARLNDVPRYFAEQTVNMRAGLKRGFSVPRAVLGGRDVSIAAVADLEDPRQSEFFKPLANLPASMSTEEQEQLREAASKAIAEQVIPAYQQLLTFFRDEYVPRARKTLAAEAMPNGKAWYRQQIREYTTLDLTPEAIHKIGLAEVARIHAEMQETMREAKFDGDFPAFLAFLRSDPQFYAKTPEELLMRAAWIAKRVDGHRRLAIPVGIEHRAGLADLGAEQHHVQVAEIGLFRCIEIFIADVATT